MTHHLLTKAERERIAGMYSDGYIHRLLADLDAAEAERDAAQERVDLDIDEFRRILSEMDNLRVRIPVTPEGGRILYDLVQGIVMRATNAGRQRVPLIAQRDRAESELDVERRMRVEAEAASDRAESERATAESIAAQATALMEEMRDDRDVLKAKLAELAEAAECGTGGRIVTREQLLALLRDAVNYLEHYDWCEHRSNWFLGVVCDCGQRELMVRVEDALANYPGLPESSTPTPADLLDARDETLHVEQPAHRTTPIGGDDDGN